MTEHARNSIDTDSAQRPVTGVPKARAMLFDADGKDSELDAAQIDSSRLSEHQLLWVDLCGDDDAALADVLARLGLGDHVAAVRAGLRGRPRVENFGEWFLLRASAIFDGGDSQSDDDKPSDKQRPRRARAAHRRFSAQDFNIVTGHNFVLSLHAEPLGFIDALREREQAETQLGVLSAESFTASLLDWQLATYFDAVSAFEAEVDQLEVNLLSRRRQRDYLPDLADLRRVVSRLRRTLAPHRNLFAALERPDFRPSKDNAAADTHFHQVGKRFDHAMEAVENARDLVVGSFELFATRAAQRTNDNMRRLTFATVLIGTLAVLAGILGMNFSVAFFDSGAKGFWSAIAGMVTLAVAALAVAHARDWI
ncbi:MAG: CorA family divalent cation transporter [Lysobacter sp.]|nr:CorA family divalent cation transporter [Lysobacter sp.]